MKVEMINHNVVYVEIGDGRYIYIDTSIQGELIVHLLNTDGSVIDLTQNVKVSDAGSPENID